MSEKKDLKRMCDHCYHIVDENEDMYGFLVIDDYNYERAFKGHESCVQEMIEELRKIFPKRENN